MASLVAVSDPAVAWNPSGQDHDAVVLVSADPAAADVGPLQSALAAAARADARFGASVSMLPAEAAAGGRLIVAPTGPLGRDQDDVRRFAQATAQGVARARDAGAVRPLVLLDAGSAAADPIHREAVAVAALGALEPLWQPLEAREALGDQVEPVQAVGFAALGLEVSEGLAEWASAVEHGRRVARDLGGTEPERMAPPRFADYCVDVFAGTAVQTSVIEGEELLTGYPLLSAVARASVPVERHRPRVVRLVYEGAGPIERTLLFAGKGVTYDTGGADIKAGGHMAGMSRDKGGAAVVAGFMAALAKLKPAGVKVIAELGCVRNSIGAECFVTDEVITGHAGVRVRIGNTDAEGRLVLADLLSQLREQAGGAPDPRLFSVATLTGHAAKAVGPYSIALDNGPARALGVAESLGVAGDAFGDPFDLSRLRPEDYDFVRPRSQADDVLSCNNAPSSATARGHQFPMAFLAIASGLDRHGRDADVPLPYTHVDIAGSFTEDGDWQHGRPTGRPVVAMLAALLASGGRPE